VKIAEAYGLKGIRVTQRSEVADAIRAAQETEGTVVIDFRVEKEDSVYPMVPAGADLHEMIRRPLPPKDGDYFVPQNVIVESGADDEWDISVK
jgi:acetolactate synthase-1/2/3 large subunit